MDFVYSGSSKKIAGGTHNNWVTMIFVTPNKYNCFRKQIYIDIYTQAFHDLERFGFEFSDFGFTMSHVNFLVNIPKRYSIQIAEITLKSYTVRKMLRSFWNFGNDIPAMVSGVDTIITNLQDGKILNSQVLTSVINHDTIMHMLLMIISINYLRWFNRRVRYGNAR
jgi:hypothetical protein